MSDWIAAENKLVSRFAIVIAVTHSIKCLRDCLKSLEGLNYRQNQYHVVLVDCNVIEGLKYFFEKALFHYKCRITTITLPLQENKFPAWLHEARLNEARNSAMRKVSAQYYVFTEDDCMFEPDWLLKFDHVLDDENLGAVGGPDILQEGMDWLPRALDCVLNSFLGTAGAKRGDGAKSEWYYPRKENTVIPARVISRIGKFPENTIFGAEMEMAKRIRDAGLQIKYLPDNPVWHWRYTSFYNLIRRNLYNAAEKVKLMRREKIFTRSPHFLVLMAVVSGFILTLFIPFSAAARFIFLTLILLYAGIALFKAVSALYKTRSISVGLGVLLLLPSHHLSITLGVLRGVFSKSVSGE